MQGGKSTALPLTTELILFLSADIGSSHGCGHAVARVAQLAGCQTLELSEVVVRVRQWWRVASGGSGQFTRSSVSFFIFIIFFCIL